MIAINEDIIDWNIKYVSTSRNHKIERKTKNGRQGNSTMGPTTKNTQWLQNIIIDKIIVAAPEFLSFCDNLLIYTSHFSFPLVRSS